MENTGYKVVAVMFFGKQEVGRFATREQAEWRAKEMNAWAERNPRGCVQYLVRPVKSLTKTRRYEKPERAW